MKIYEGKSLSYEGMISYRNCYKNLDFYMDIQQVRERIEDEIDFSDKRMLTIIHNINNDTGNLSFDVEVLFKLKENGNITDGYNYVEKFEVNNAICAELIDEFDKVNEATQQLNQLAMDRLYSIGKNVWVQYTRDGKSYLELCAEVI